MVTFTAVGTPSVLDKKQSHDPCFLIVAAH